MTPAPITIRCLGTSGRASAPVESTIRFWSTSTPASGAGSEPVAMTIAPGSSVVTAPSVGGRPRPCRARRGAPAPLIQSTLFFLNRNSTPLVSWRDRSRPSASSSPAGSASASTSMPKPAKSLPASLEEFGGVQQRLGGDAADVEAGAAQGRALSTQAAFRPSWPARMARVVAARPAADDDRRRMQSSRCDCFAQTSSSRRCGSSMCSLTLTRKVTAPWPSTTR